MPTLHPLDQSDPAATFGYHPSDQSEHALMPTLHPVDQSDPSAHHEVTASSQSNGPSGEEPVQSEGMVCGSNQWESSCTLVEGLLFPLEYYVRTTRRMASSQSPLDLQAVILSQLSRGRGKRRASQSRPSVTPFGGCGAVASEDSYVQMDSEPIRVEDSSLHLDSKPMGAEVSSLQTASRPIRARRRRRGAGWARKPRQSRIPSPSWTNEDAASDTESRPQTHSEPIKGDDDHLATRPLTHSEPIKGDDHIETRPLTHSEPIKGDDHLATRPPIISGPVTADGRMETHPLVNVAVETKPLPPERLLLLPEVYPIFRRGCGQKRKRTQMEKEVSPLLPSLSSLTQALKAEDHGSLRSLLLTFDLQDFHLPDDEFGQLKLQKLRPLVMGVEPYSPPSSGLTTRRSNRRHSNRAAANTTPSNSQRSKRSLLEPQSEHIDWLSPDPLLLSPTPTGSEVLGPPQLSSQSDGRADEPDQSQAQKEMKPITGLTDTKDQSETRSGTADQSDSTEQADDQLRQRWTIDQSERQGDSTTDQSERQGDSTIDQSERQGESLAGSRLASTDVASHTDTHSTVETNTHTDTDTHTASDADTVTHTHTDTHILADTHTDTLTDLCQLKDSNTLSDTPTHTHAVTGTAQSGAEHTHTHTHAHTHSLLKPQPVTDLTHPEGSRP
ncbi:uncharacterized protein LOC125298007 [Alosa alosa]|uniref:uncharacterized protein LOC125298007 n=1 Tax=Alosa alosa TaxID=278164 RepID=UPI0020151E14|nr:uncharacterized protein LOC125298007 [Alosa alosa]